MSRPLSVALIATVLNEQPRLATWLAALDAQTRVPDEIAIIDGGSVDGTWECLQDWASRSGAVVRRCPGAGIPEGRNLAISLVTSEIVAVTDAGTRADPRWLTKLVAAFEGGDVDVASGFFQPELTDRWSRALAAATLPDVGDIDPGRFQPSSRSLAFRRSWWEAGLRYPEWLDYCEDLVWDFAMRRAGARFCFVPTATVEFTVRPSPREFAVQYYRYARGDGKAGLFPRRHLLRYATYGGAAAVVALRDRGALFVAGGLGVAYIWSSTRRLWRRDRARGVSRRETVALFPLVAALRAIGDIAKMIGYPAGLLWRIRRFGGLGWRTSWQRISPAGVVWSPAELTRGSRPPTSLPDDGSRAARQ